MIIDLHCHTKAVKTGESRSRNVTPELFAEKLDEAGVEIVAVTNHNCFDFDQFGKLADAAVGQTQVWPGVELDVSQPNGNKWHIVVVVNPAQVNDFASAVNSLVCLEDVNTCCLEFEKVWNSLKAFDAIFISHCHDKTPYVTESDIEYMNVVTGNDWRLYYEPRTLVTLGIWSNHGRNMMMGSDVQDWDEYEQCDFVSLRLPVDSFEQFFLLAKRDHQVVDTLLGSCSVNTWSVSPHSTVSFDLTFFKDINVIFGQKGTGKTEIMKSLRVCYDKLGIQYSCYFGGEKSDEYDKLLATSSITLTMEEMGREDAMDDIADIRCWGDAVPTTLEKYVSWFTTKENNKKKAAFKISDCQAAPEKSDSEFRVRTADEQTVKGFQDAYGKHGLSRYLDDEEAAVLETMLQKIALGAKAAAIAEYIDIASIKMANTALDEIKGLIDKKSDTQSIPSKCGLLEYVSSRIELYNAANKVLAQLTPKTDCKKKYLGELEGKGRLHLVTRKRFLQTGSKTIEFKLGIQTLRKWKEALEKVRDNAFSVDLPTHVKAFVEVDEVSGIGSLAEFIGIEKYVVREGSDDRYDPSDGEKGMIIIERKLRDANADVYLLDEPELGMSNLYIDSVIRPIIQDLARSGKTVIISTHNANLAVRTLPYQSIYREHVGGNDFRTFIGNPFTDELVDMEKHAESISWSETSMATLEGGPEAFYDRLTIYEAGNHGN